MTHLNFGKNQRTLSTGIEFAIWKYHVKEMFMFGSAPADGDPGYGADFGMEWDEGKFRLYAEAQSGVVYAGASLGPVVEWSGDWTPSIGLQGSIWANYLLGLDLRYRRVNGENWLAPGAYGKLFLAVDHPTLECEDRVDPC
jgi:hypothetical protein